MTSPRRVVLLGSTGSIGTQALDVIGRNRDRFAVGGIASGGRSVARLAEQAVAFDVPVVAVADPAAARDLGAAIAAERVRAGLEPADGPRIHAGPDAIVDLAAADCDVVLNAIAGAAGLMATLAALRAGSMLALANKESLIVGGPVVKALAAAGQIVPVDSEHSALAQALRGGRANEVRRLVVTASGGPFRGFSAEDLADVTVEQALAHPTWSMGPLVTVNSATLMNKGLEVIEAHLLFDIALDRIDVVVHPQSIVHSMVEFVDGSTLAQASPPDMRIPIALGLAWPERVHDAAPGCDWGTAATWEFFPLDDEVFPAVRLARHAGARGGTAPAVLNAADEACVAAFLTGSLPFARIVPTVASVLAEHLDVGRTTGGGPARELVAPRSTVGHVPWLPAAQTTLADVMTADGWARDRVTEILEQPATDSGSHGG